MTLSVTVLNNTLPGCFETGALAVLFKVLLLPLSGGVARFPELLLAVGVGFAVARPVENLVSVLTLAE